MVDPIILRKRQQKRAVSFKFEDVSSFSATFAIVRDRTGMGRNFFMAGETTLMQGCEKPNLVSKRSKIERIGSRAEEVAELREAASKVESIKAALEVTEDRAKHAEDLVDRLGDNIKEALKKIKEAKRDEERSLGKAAETANEMQTAAAATADTTREAAQGHASTSSGSIFDVQSAMDKAAQELVERQRLQHEYDEFLRKGHMQRHRRHLLVSMEAAANETNMAFDDVEDNLKDAMHGLDQTGASPEAVEQIWKKAALWLQKLKTSRSDAEAGFKHLLFTVDTQSEIIQKAEGYRNLLIKLAQDERKKATELYTNLTMAQWSFRKKRYMLQEQAVVKPKEENRSVY